MRRQGGAVRRDQGTLIVYYVVLCYVMLYDVMSSYVTLSDYCHRYYHQGAPHGRDRGPEGRPGDPRGRDRPRAEVL